MVGVMKTGATACALLCALAVAATSVAAAHPAERAMLESVNKVRHANGLRPLRPSSSLMASSGRYARFILKSDYFGHQARIWASRRFSALGENLAWHSGRRPGVAFTVRAWLNSPSHRAVMLNPRYRWLGAGMARGRLGAREATVWVLHVGG
jgi:uncharacterized protein YkwD